MIIQTHTKGAIIILIHLPHPFSQVCTEGSESSYHFIETRSKSANTFKQPVRLFASASYHFIKNEKQVAENFEIR